MEMMKIFVGILYVEKHIKTGWKPGVREKVIEYWDNHSRAIPD